ncbi:hypothetical protein DFS33DRAFT_1340557 [Desarmillaria ectypa]|nr:hypothetical protein DFS33DRAFT_1340557 [Desarmillaria ectypa]
MMDSPLRALLAGQSFLLVGFSVFLVCSPAAYPMHPEVSASSFRVSVSSSLPQLYLSPNNSTAMSLQASDASSSKQKH